MKRLTPIPREWVDHMNGHRQTGPGYHVVAVTLKNGRCFDQVVASEGCVIHVRGHKEVPFAADDVASISVNHMGWNFRVE
jgi:hypothetical protein